MKIAEPEDSIFLPEEEDESPPWVAEHFLDLLATGTLLMVLVYLLGDWLRFPWAGRPLIALAGLAGLAHFDRMPRISVSLGCICLAVIVGTWWSY